MTFSCIAMPSFIAPSSACAFMASSFFSSASLFGSGTSFPDYSTSPCDPAASLCNYGASSSDSVSSSLHMAASFCAFAMTADPQKDAAASEKDAAMSEADAAEAEGDEETVSMADFISLGDTLFIGADDTEGKFDYTGRQKDDVDLKKVLANLHGAVTNGRRSSDEPHFDATVRNRQPSVGNPECAVGHRLLSARKPGSTLRISHSALGIPHSAFRNPGSAGCNPHFPMPWLSASRCSIRGIRGMIRNSCGDLCRGRMRPF